MDYEPLENILNKLRQNRFQSRFKRKQREDYANTKVPKPKRKRV